ncbi:hypothetical protein GE061_006119 [Apolygus lucorum]|uniref:Protein RIC1 homolog n=1 Tax=Apolygus lucorum TaxID=248454 RepID=A0A6A4J6Y1_APOLU|nr:hypothetical protein GE061_006119 [Apolygus lucorum]
MNELVEWKPDSSALIVVTSCGYLLLYKVKCDTEQKGVFELIDPPQASLRRDSAELFMKETIPCLHLNLELQVSVGGIVTSFCCIRDELMVATSRGHVLRYRWDGTLNRDYSVDLRRVPFCLDQQVSKAVPISDNNTYIIDIDYSPLIGGFAVVFNDGRAAFLTAYSLKFDPNQMQGIWAPNIDDATCATVNHKFRLITIGRRNSQCVVYSVDETTGGLIVSHQLIIPGQVYPGTIGAVHCIRWSPDACCLAVSWSSGGISLWSTFGALLMCSLSWDYGIHADLNVHNPLTIHSMEWSAEGYQLWMAKNVDHVVEEEAAQSSVIQFSFVKSALTINPCISHQNHLYLQGEDRLYVNLGAGLSQVLTSNSGRDSPLPFTAALADSKQWIVVQIPSAYSATNWPIRYTAIDEDGDKIAVAGRAGLAHYSLTHHKWKLFGNETQEKDMLVTGGLLWWGDYIIAGSYDIPNQKDELRLYPSSARLSNVHMTSHQLESQILLLDCLQDKLLVFGADVRIMIFQLSEKSGELEGIGRVQLTCIQAVDLSALCVHPACFVAITLTSLRIEPSRFQTPFLNNFVINISGRLLMVNPHEGDRNVLQTPSILASCVENVWSPSKFNEAKPHLTEALWLFCGAHGMRVWLPLFPRQGDNAHTFMSKRIMLPFQLGIYPLAILFEDAILLGAENDTILYSSDANSPFSLPFCLLERTSQVYLHHILRQLIRRNLGFHAWEIARCCTSLPYFPHSLELLLHEVLEEEATSKEPIPDAQLPSVIEFIQEFPVYLDTVVRCARKTEIALWPYLFSVAGKPTSLFQKCLSSSLLETAASYLIILQNLESSSVSRQFATMLLDSTLSSSKWELSKELVRFLKAIDPNDVEVSRVPSLLTSSCKIPHTPQVNGNEEDLSLVLGTTQVSRGRSFSTTTTPKINPEKMIAQSRTSATDINMNRKKSVPTSKTDTKDNSQSAEEFFMDVMIERHARRLLTQQKLNDLGCMAANLDFPLVRWLAKERNRAAVVESCVTALNSLHRDFSWPYPVLSNMSHGSLSPMEKEGGFLADMGESTSQIGDSGYMSFQGNIIGLPKEHQAHPNHQQLDERSIVSEADSWFFNEETEVGNVSMFPWSELPSPQLLDNLSKQVTTRGPAKADIQLRYLLQLLSDAGCLQWALLVSILLRDAMAVYRLVNAARSADQSYETVARLRDDILSLYQWSCSDCPGYKPFMSVVQSQASSLNKILSSKYRNPESVPELAIQSTFDAEKRGNIPKTTPVKQEDVFTPSRQTIPSTLPVADPYDRSACIIS